jgi:ABC-2 type transport system permease protein
VRTLVLERVHAVLLKEFIQMRRDKLTFGMIVGVPILQLLLFGYAINNDPKHLPTALFIHDQSAVTRSITNALENSRYFDIVESHQVAAAADASLRRGDVAFVVTIPEGFTRQLLRGEQPSILVEADATDPSAAVNALAAINQLTTGALRHLRLEAAGIVPATTPFETVVHRRYNPEGITQYNIVPALLGVILTMTMVMMTSMALTREVERGTIENLLSMPARPGEVMLGKLTPYFLVSGLQVLLILGMARLVFGVPMLGSWILLITAIGFFVIALALLGYLISTVARNQMQAMQVTFFFFLPSILLSGFMFPFRGMPGWAQAIGEVLPLTHFLRLVRGVMLKGSALIDILPHVWPLLLFSLVVGTLALKRYRQTLDD